MPPIRLDEEARQFDAFLSVGRGMSGTENITERISD